MRSLLPIFLAFACGAQAAEMPVREVILYKSGVAYFDRQGQLAAGETARLDFKAEEMNDVLKSLVVQDLSGAKITGLRYDSSEPLEQKLAEFPFKLGDRQSLSGFLDQVKGTRVELKLGPESASGVIVGARAVAATEKEPAREQVVLMLDSGALRTFDLTQVASLRFADPQIHVQLKDYLSALSQARSKDKRSVYLDSTDRDARELTASYMIPAPVWKSSYRLVFGDKPEPTLEGWAIVDNTTGDDWTNVKLAVVSGRPVSFISRLYEPKFIQRPTADLEDEGPAAPQVYEAGIAGGMAAAAPAPPAAFKRKGILAREGVGLATESVQADALSSVMPNAQGRDLGELFEYSFSVPVTVKKNESAMLPFLQQTVGARKLLIFRDGNGANPMNAAEITNSTGKTLDGGPITVFDGHGYSGEALIETLKAGDKRLISYAVDLGTRVTTNLDSSSEIVREAHLDHGMLETKLAAEETQTYTIRNVDAKAKTLIIEHPLRAGYKLLNQKPTETTSSAYRFEVRLTPDSTRQFEVGEERVYRSQTQVSGLTPEVLLAYVENRRLSEAARASLEKIRGSKQKLAETSSAIQQAESSLNDLSADEQRVRQNIDSLRAVRSQAEQVNKYADQLANQETQIAGLRDRLSQLKRDQASQQAALEDMIAKLEF